jgi:hypothetical protein
MSHFDYGGDPAGAFALTMLLADKPGREAGFVRARIAATVWMPGLLLVAVLGHWTQNALVVAVSTVVLVAGLIRFATSAAKRT